MSDHKINLAQYLKSIKKFNYVVCKLDVPYMPHNFPISYPIGKDLDVYVSLEDFNELVKHTERFFSNYSFNKIKIQKEKNFRLRLLEDQTDKLHYQIDISCSSQHVEGRTKIDFYYVASKNIEKQIRLDEVKRNPHKKHHLEWLKKNG